MSHPGREIAIQFRTQNAHPNGFYEALDLANFYDIPCFHRLLIVTLMQVARQGWLYALTAFVIAVKMTDESLAEFAMQRFGNLPKVDKLDKDVAVEIGVDAYREMARAYFSSFGYTGHI